MAEPLNNLEFATHRYQDTLAVSLVGMSNVGKSFWSERLVAEEGFGRLCCDDMIEAELGCELASLGYAGGIADVAKWMGQPSNPQFEGPEGTEATYLRHETDAMQSIIGQIDAGTLAGNTVIDTTGSIVHTDRQIRDNLRDRTTVVYLEATKAMQKTMFDMFMDEPKPVVWQKLYAPRKGESERKTLERCYPELLRHRSWHYQQMAHVTISREVLLKTKSADTFLWRIFKALPEKERILT
jgi:shikimate kinase